ncbi:tRNA (guanine-N(7)-)-methyltransferase [Phytophthora cinnamomi]|uniref:tRNA (guanine-N(7)-)-methyltransferase n=1 Tax=Phytophthora cinnamomi TaxID=4785 RepID=UPI0035593DA7|nr:tRNA (guanine-N(7)-)-methyltransferase [Phytophthora cinnamomi]
MALLNRSRRLRLGGEGMASTCILRRDSLLRCFSATTPKFGAVGATGSSPPGNSPSGSKRFRQHVNPLSMVYRQPVELPDWNECFADASLPIHLDIGCARGKYLMDVAASQVAERNFVGVEIRRNVLQEAEREAERRGLENLAFVHANMNIHQASLLQSLPAPVKSVSIFHPDPWMKKRHIKRRLVTDEFVEEMAKHLPNGTPIYVQTDVEELFAYMVEVFELSRLYDFDALHENPLGIPTDREKFVYNEGGDIYRVKFIVDKPKEEAEEEVPTSSDA